MNLVDVTDLVFKGLYLVFLLFMLGLVIAELYFRVKECRKKPKGIIEAYKHMADCHSGHFTLLFAFIVTLGMLIALFAYSILH